MKKLFAVLIAGLLLAGTFIGCTSTKTTDVEQEKNMPTWSEEFIFAVSKYPDWNTHSWYAWAMAYNVDNFEPGVTVYVLAVENPKTKKQYYPYFSKKSDILKMIKHLKDPLTITCIDDMDNIFGHNYTAIPEEFRIFKKSIDVPTVEETDDTVEPVEPAELENKE